MTTLTDAFYFPILVIGSVFSALDSVSFSDQSFSLLDIFLAFIFIIITMEFIFWMFEVDVDFWSYVFGD